MSSSWTFQKRSTKWTIVSIYTSQSHMEFGAPSTDGYRTWSFFRKIFSFSQALSMLIALTEFGHWFHEYLLQNSHKIFHLVLHPKKDNVNFDQSNIMYVITRAFYIHFFSWFFFVCLPIWSRGWCKGFFVKGISDKYISYFFFPGHLTSLFFQLFGRTMQDLSSVLLFLFQYLYLFDGKLLGLSKILAFDGVII